MALSNRILQCPVALFIFNRPETTDHVFNSIRQAKPSQLLIIADGPRSEYPEDTEQCAKARAIVEEIDWNCDVRTNYAETNLGCKKRVASGLDWVFENVPEAIVLEDDCVPHPSFFRFASELLERFRDDDRIAVVSGNNHQFGRRRTPYSYYFSRFGHIWGWATWRRAWQHCDLALELWPEVRERGLLKDILDDGAAVSYWTKIFDATYNNQIDAWSYAWTFSCWIHHLLSILPEINLVTNIGFHAAATHTRGRSKFANMPVQEMSFPLRHPPYMIRNREADAYTQRTLFHVPWWKKVPGKLRSILRRR